MDHSVLFASEDMVSFRPTALPVLKPFLKQRSFFKYLARFDTKKCQFWNNSRTFRYNLLVFGFQTNSGVIFETIDDLVRFETNFTIFVKTKLFRWICLDCLTLYKYLVCYPNNIFLGFLNSNH